MFTTANAARAYELAQQDRRDGTPVIMGGAHASALPEEALRYADSVVVGEGESVWPEVLRDLERGALKREVPLWLNLPEFRAIVVGFESAAIGHGGEGALYVRLRKRRP